MFFYTVILLQLVPLIINNIAVPKRMLLFFYIGAKIVSCAFTYCVYKAVGLGELAGSDVLLGIDVKSF